VRLAAQRGTPSTNACAAIAGADPADVYLQIEMFVRGLWFIVLAGDAVPQDLRSLSLLGSPNSPIHLKDCTDQAVIRNRHFLELAENDFK
jgi:hypothetical protein